MTEGLYLALGVLNHPLGLAVADPRHDGDRGFETSCGYVLPLWPAWKPLISCLAQVSTRAKSSPLLIRPWSELPFPAIGQDRGLTRGGSSGIMQTD